MPNESSSWNMYIPKAYRSDDPASIIDRFPFGQLVTSHEGFPYATAVPMYLDVQPDGTTQLVGHLARHNPHAGTLAKGQPALAIFTGPNAYISASWYEERPTVPTWNYIAAQVRGVLTPVDDDDEQLSIMRTTIRRSETDSSSNWMMEHAPDGKVETLLPHIRSFRIAISQMDAVTKLSQTHPVGDQTRVADALEARGKVADLEIARYMRDLLAN
ncbi:MAG TPA: FMN-binding negative transcriptional regulator [Hyphomonas atlantica]|uniref:FMN-binding negative transcriptional regulator n=1 Tax=Hyphomonas atlantica TaxID=1280948 RepID=A0A356W908_9PROT|nr:MULTISPECIES: FMN-binding negative transcriptional regulator [Hyphomonas]MAM08823.1 transcriptional repressor of sporulation and degradative enzyme production [Hyphomonas sp.]HAE94030.1 FMN-binding negative transcriptional regulator [Hyphomonas atlantica]HBQ49518.1 FMN-binding negative transcriptional regulator [Hyphomonas atlantica]|tara:strand:- start:2180 stop:2824 length:645 start_codon:yes stop_codon:yes gene_type:complete